MESYNIIEKREGVKEAVKPPYLRVLHGVLFYIWVCIHILGYSIGLMDTDGYRSGYYIHAFFSVYELILVYSISIDRPDHRDRSNRNILTLCKLSICVVISMAGLSGRPWWLNIFFLNNISYVADIMHIRYLMRLVKTQEIPSLKRLENFARLFYIIRMTRYIPILITCYIGANTGSWSICVLLAVYLIASLFS